MATSSHGSPEPGVSQPIRDGMPFKKMHQLREEVRIASEKLADDMALAATAQSDPDCPPDVRKTLRASTKIQSARLITLREKLAPMEINFKKSQGTYRSPSRELVASPSPQPTKKLKTEDKHITSHPSRQTVIALEPMANSATREFASSSGPCTLTPEKCQYDHLDRLRRQYARPFQLFCEEMDSISDSCLTGICLSLPDMPWSIAVSRLAFLLQSTIDSHDKSPPLSDGRHTTAGTTVGCNVHARLIRLVEVMAIENWRDFTSWAHHHSHVINLCGQRNCIKLKHVCLESVHCTESRGRCQTGSERVLNETARSPLECKSSGCWPPCLPQHSTANILHSVAIEFAALHQVSFGPLKSAANADLYSPISEQQLGKLVNDRSIGLKLPFDKSYGHIPISKMEDGLFVDVATPLHIPSMYTWEDMQSITPKLPTWTEMPFNEILSSIFWYARKRNMPFLRENPVVAVFSLKSPTYQCPFCHGFDADFHAGDSLGRVPSGFRSLDLAVHHILHDHTRVPIERKIKFLYEETQQCSSICDSWKLILKDEFDASIASLGEGKMPKAIAYPFRYNMITASDTASAKIDEDPEEKEGMKTRVKNALDDTSDGPVLMEVSLQSEYRSKWERACRMLDMEAWSMVSDETTDLKSKGKAITAEETADGADENDNLFKTDLNNVIKNRPLTRGKVIDWAKAAENTPADDDYDDDDDSDFQPMEETEEDSET